MKRNLAFLGAALALMFAAGVKASEPIPVAKEPQCIKKCGEALQKVQPDCQAAGRSCLGGCDLQGKAKECVNTCLEQGLLSSIACVGRCSVEEARDCCEGCTDKMTVCYEKGLTDHKACEAACPER